MFDMTPEPTYIFENGKAYAVANGQVIASAGDVDELEERLAEQAKKTATHVVTPNGLKGKILGRVAGVWSEEVTVRFDNGRIVRLPADALSFTREAGAIEANPLVGLTARLAETAESFDAKSLETRYKDLEAIKVEASNYIANGRSPDDEQSLNDIVVQASYEQQEVNDALLHIANGMAEAYAPPAPFSINVVEQGGPSRAATWLDKPLGEMIAEAAATDYEKLMDEGPEAFVAELESGALADASVARSIASTWIRSHTAAADEWLRDKYESVWLSRVEQVRRDVYANVKDKLHREAAAAPEDDTTDAPDEALFA